MDISHVHGDGRRVTAVSHVQDDGEGDEGPNPC